MGLTLRNRRVLIAIAGVALAVLAVAIVAGSRGGPALAADHLEAPIVAAKVDLVSSEMGPVRPFGGRGILHMSKRPAGSRETIVANFAGLAANGKYNLALTRGTCRAMGELHTFFDLGAELAFTAGPDGSMAVNQVMNLTRPRPVGIARTAVLRRASDGAPVACGRLLAFGRVAVK